MSRTITPDATSQSTRVRIVDTAGVPVTNATSASAGLVLSYQREGGLAVAISLSDLGAVDAAWSSGGIIHVFGGYYRLDIPNAALVTGVTGVLVGGVITGGVIVAAYHPIDARVASREALGAATAALAAIGATASRMGYLDNLNVGGLIASQAEALAIQNNTRVVISVPEQMIRPDAGSVAVVYHISLYDTDGNMEAPDSTPTVTVADALGNDLSAALSALTVLGTGSYRGTYTLTSADDLEELIFSITVVEGGLTRTYRRPSWVVDAARQDFTSGDRAKLDTLHDTRLTAGRASNLDNLDAAILTRAAPGDAMTLTAGERTAIANALLDLANAIEIGGTVRLALRRMAAKLVGKTVGAGTDTEQYKGMGVETVRETDTVTAAGERTAVVFS